MILKIFCICIAFAVLLACSAAASLVNGAFEHNMEKAETLPADRPSSADGAYSIPLALTVIFVLLAVAVLVFALCRLG